MVKIDVKDAYYSILILNEHQKFLKFSLQGKLYKFTCSPLAELRLDYARIAEYIEDLITLAYSFDICFKDV